MYRNHPGFVKLVMHVINVLFQTNKKRTKNLAYLLNLCDILSWGEKSEQFKTSHSSSQTTP